MFFSSASAHLIHQKSHYCHMTCFLCDFGGISFNAFGSAFMQIYSCSPIWYFKMLEPYLLPLIGFQSALCLLLNSLAQTLYKRPYPPMKRFLQFAPCGILWVFTLTPVIVSLIWPGDMALNYRYHLLHVVVFLTGAVLFALDIPQRFFPGQLDFFGQGHNLFHLCIFIVVACQFNGCYNDYVDNRAIIAASRNEPTGLFCFTSLLALVIYYVYVIFTFNRMIVHNFDHEGNLIHPEVNEKEVGEVNKVSADEMPLIESEELPELATVCDYENDEVFVDADNLKED
ncbi:unnamed protein product [Sphagnum jensenii]|uniref:Uncharacterized protein n=1 Tax=Sphagnum jensenii TaxID=128206 RepID=A0ABP0VIH8_9BRYO